MPVIKLDKKWQEEEKRIYDRGHKYDQQAKQPRHHKAVFKFGGIFDHI